MVLLGVIGGLGPMATAYFMELITAMTDADHDQAHLPMLVYHAPNIPDRTAYILGQSNDDPLPGIIEAGRTLGAMGANILAIPCITAHCFHERIENETGIFTLHAIRECKKVLLEGNITRVGIMATDGTIKCGLFQDELEKCGIQTILPTVVGQKRVMDLIYRDIKKGREPNMNDFFSVKNELTASGAQVVLLGCTELSLIKRDYNTGDGVLDIMEVLAASAIQACGKHVRCANKKMVIL